MTLENFTKEFEAFYSLRTGMSCFADGGGDAEEIERYWNNDYTPYDAVSREIDRYGMDDLGDSEIADRQSLRRDGVL